MAGAFADSKGRYGYRRIKAVLKTGVSEKVVRRIMAEEGLVAHVPKRRRYGSYEGETTPAPANLVDRDFTAERPNEKWLTDISEIKARDGKGVPFAAGRLLRWQDRRIHRRLQPQRGAGQPDAGESGLDAAGERASPGAFRPWMPLPVARMARAHGTLRADALHEREGLFPGQRRRGGVLRSNEDGIRLSRALGETHTRRGAHPDRRLHPLVQPRAHQTVAWLDESCTIPSKPGNGCVIISKKMSAAPYLCCRHHAHDGQGNSNNRSKATLQGMALPSRFLSVPPLNPQRTNFNFEPIVSPHRFAISFSGGYCIQSYNWGQKNKKRSFAGAG